MTFRACHSRLEHLGPTPLNTITILRMNLQKDVRSHQPLTNSSFQTVSNETSACYGLSINRLISDLFLPTWWFDPENFTVKIKSCQLRVSGGQFLTTCFGYFCPKLVLRNFFTKIQPTELLQKFIRFHQTRGNALM